MTQDLKFGYQRLVTLLLARDLDLKARSRDELYAPFFSRSSSPVVARPLDSITHFQQSEMVITPPLRKQTYRIKTAFLQQRCVPWLHLFSNFGNDTLVFFSRNDG